MSQAHRTFNCTRTELTVLCFVDCTDTIDVMVERKFRSVSYSVHTMIICSQRLEAAEGIVDCAPCLSHS